MTNIHFIFMCLILVLTNVLSTKGLTPCILQWYSGRSIKLSLDGSLKPRRSTRCIFTKIPKEQRSPCLFHTEVLKHRHHSRIGQYLANTKYYSGSFHFHVIILVKTATDESDDNTLRVNIIDSMWTLDRSAVWNEVNCYQSYPWSIWPHGGVEKSKAPKSNDNRIQRRRFYSSMKLGGQE